MGSVPLDSLHRTAGRGRGGDTCRWQGRFVRQCHGRVGDGMYKTELVRRGGPWRGLDDLEWTGSTTADSMERSATSHRPSMNPTATVPASRYGWDPT